MSVTTSETSLGEERRLHPVWIVYSAIQSLRALIFPIVIMLLSGGNALQWFGVGTALAITAAVVVYRAVLWTRFTYQITDQGIWVHSGLVSRQERFVPADRIQSIDFNESVLHRLLGVVAVKIESAAAGSEGADVTLQAVSRAEAERIREQLLERRHAAIGTSSPQTAVSTDDQGIAVEGELIARVPYSRLLVAGATSGRIGPALGLIFAALQFSDNVLPGRVWSRIGEAVPHPTVQLIAGFALVGALLAWTFAILSTLLTFGNFELRRVENRLQATYGLLERRRVSIPLSRIQAITISEGLLRQPFGLAAIRAESAGYGKQTAESGVLMPILRRAEASAFLDRAVPDFAVDLASLQLRRPPARARRRYILGPVWGVLIFVVIGVVAGIVIGPLSWRWAGLAVPILVPAGLIGWLRYRDAGWMVGPDGAVVVRGRSIDRVTVVTRVRRIQHRGLGESPMQRRARLVSFNAAVASGGSGELLEIPHLDRDDGVSLLDQLRSPVQSTTHASA
jgi:putative membrane protein